MGRYYSIQTEAAYRSLQEYGVLFGSERHVWNEFKDAYRWLCEQAKIDGFPVWVWTKEPDLRDEALLPKGERGVCLVLEIPDEDVTLSSFDAWHCVLNGDFCPLTSDEDEAFEDGEAAITLEESWQRIFDMETLAASEMWGGEQHIQGVTRCFTSGHIVAVRHFTAR